MCDRIIYIFHYRGIILSYGTVKYDSFISYVYYVLLLRIILLIVVDL
jgi:hypothetical protein